MGRRRRRAARRQQVERPVRAAGPTSTSQTPRHSSWIWCGVFFLRRRAAACGSRLGPSSRQSRDSPDHRCFRKVTRRQRRTWASDSSTNMLTLEGLTQTSSSRRTSRYRDWRKAGRGRTTDRRLRLTLRAGRARSTTERRSTSARCSRGVEARRRAAARIARSIRRSAISRAIRARRRSGAGARAVAAVCASCPKILSSPLIDRTAERRHRSVPTRSDRDRSRSGAGAFRPLLPRRALRSNESSFGHSTRCEPAWTQSASRRSGHGYRRAARRRGVHSERRRPGHLVCSAGTSSSIAFNSRTLAVSIAGGSPGAERGHRSRRADQERASRTRATSATGPIWPKHWAYDTSVPAVQLRSRARRVPSGRRRVSGLEQRAAAAGRRRGCDSPACLPENFSAAGADRRWRSRSSFTTSASTCSSRSCRSRNTTRAIRDGRFRCGSAST